VTVPEADLVTKLGQTRRACDTDAVANVVDADSPDGVEVTVWDLEMNADPGRRAATRDDLALMHATEPAPELARFFYAEGGRDFNWRGRMDWPRERWADEANRDTNHLWSCWRNGTPVGYFVLEENSPDTVGNTELLYFGLLPNFHGQGIGKWLLDRAISEAWALPSTQRLWLHTCSLDGPHAKTNYLARGFRKCGERTEYQLLIDAD